MQPHHFFAQLSPILLIAVAIVFGDADTASAQKVKAQVIDMNKDIFGPQRHSTADPEQLASFLNMRIEQIDLICGLDDSQVKKLSLAGTSISNKLLARKKKRFFLGTLFNENPPEAVQEDSLSDEDAESDGNDDAKDQNGQFAMVPTITKLTEIEADPVWEKAFATVLSDSQREAWSDFISQQKTQTRQRLIQKRVLELEHDLCLHPDQIKALSEVVDRVEGDGLVKQFALGKDQIAMHRQRRRTLVSDEDLQAVLTDAQMKVWNNRNQPSAQEAVMADVLGIDFGDDLKTPVKLGVTFEDADSLKVKSVTPDSMAQSLGIEVGDIIDSFNDQPIDTQLQLKTVLNVPADVVVVEVIRDDKSIVLEKK